MSSNLDIFKIKTNNVSPKKGRVLIAEPFLAGSFFNRSVVFLVDYSEKGSVGFILNKKVEFDPNDLFPDLPGFNAGIYLGGPVSTDSIYFVHKLGDKLPGSIHIAGDLYWGGNFEVLKHNLKGGLISPSEIRFFLGYSGWESGQLEEELKGDSWLVTDVQQDDVMKELDEASWLDFVEKAGNRYSIWKNFPENPSLN